MVVKLSEMTPREIDALVAEKVMGWYWSETDEMLEGLFPPVGDYRRTLSWLNFDSNGYVLSMPNYSTNISDAWIVIDKLKGLNIVNLHYAIGEWTVDVYDFDTGKMLAISSSETAPMAICKAALKAVGIEIEEE